MIVGDHPRIPLLFGVMRKQQPVSIVLKFHGNGVKSLTLIKAAKEKKIVKWTGRKFLMWLLKSQMLYNICTNVAAKRFSINYLSSLYLSHISVAIYARQPGLVLKNWNFY